MSEEGRGFLGRVFRRPFTGLGSTVLFAMPLVFVTHPLFYLVTIPLRDRLPLGVVWGDEGITWSGWFTEIYVAKLVEPLEWGRNWFWHWGTVFTTGGWDSGLVIPVAVALGCFLVVQGRSVPLRLLGALWAAAGLAAVAWLVAAATGARDMPWPPTNLLLGPVLRSCGLAVYLFLLHLPMRRLAAPSRPWTDVLPGLAVIGLLLLQKDLLVIGPVHLAGYALGLDMPWVTTDVPWNALFWIRAATWPLIVFLPALLAVGGHRLSEILKMRPRLPDFALAVLLLLAGSLPWWLVVTACAGIELTAGSIPGLVLGSLLGAVVAGAATGAYVFLIVRCAFALVEPGEEGR